MSLSGYQTFSEYFPQLPLSEWVAKARENTSAGEIEAILSRGHIRNLEEFAALLSPLAAREYLEPMAALSKKITEQYFGKTIRLFAPLYLSNECVNICQYCGFSRHLDIPRLTLPVNRVVKEAEILAEQGFRSLLLVAGEHPRQVSSGYVEECVKALRPFIPSIALELGPVRTPQYLPMVNAGAEALIVYQETYHEATYKEMHTSGPKKRFPFRLDSPERAYDAGFRRLGIGALYGLYDWLHETLALAAHADYLKRRCWRAQLQISLPRMRPIVGEFSPRDQISDRSFVQVLCALRILLPHAGLVLSTREPAALRDSLIPLGITTMAAGSVTEPGGYEASRSPAETQHAGEQFAISDERSPAEVEAVIRAKGFEPVWKDYDAALGDSPAPMPSLKSLAAVS
ncbi:MAG: 2-iminoacetate synthase ThiH [Opitutales bacterium]|nr:2-iminoacetate synthase ThiH [Opitutales bacterium]